MWFAMSKFPQWPYNKVDVMYLMVMLWSHQWRRQGFLLLRWWFHLTTMCRMKHLHLHDLSGLSPEAGGRGGIKQDVIYWSMSQINWQTLYSTNLVTIKLSACTSAHLLQYLQQQQRSRPAVNKLQKVIRNTLNSSGIKTCSYSERDNTTQRCN